MKRLALVGVILLSVGGVVAVWRVTRPGREAAPGPLHRAITTQPGMVTSQPRQLGRTRPTTFPSARKWPRRGKLSQHTYEDTRGRWISSYNTDADSLYDADEIVRYGTLRYDGRTRPACGGPSAAPRIDDLRTPDPDDADGDGLPDEWEKGYFGTLKHGRWDDPDGDGYPNGVELARRTSPVAIDLADPKLKPASFARGVPSFRRKRGFSTDSRECWAAQAAARAASRPSGD